MADKEVIIKKVCFILAGDVVYGMAHNVPRPESSTGEMVRGSDLDIIGVTENDMNPDLVQTLDKSIHKRKHMLLMNEREELDYLIKPLSRVREQLQFDTFESMIAAKILDEGQLLFGSADVFQKVKDLINEYEIPDKIRRLENQAKENRDLAETQLLDIDMETDSSIYLNLFYTHAEEDKIY